MILNLKNSFEIQKAKLYLDKMVKSEARIELRKVMPRRTINQNKYLHSLFGLIGLELGYTSAEAKQLVKNMCPFMTYEKDNNKFTKSTADLSTKEMAGLIDWMRNQTDFGYLPSSEEYKFNYDAIIDHIKNNQQYL